MPERLVKDYDEIVKSATKKVFEIHHTETLYTEVDATGNEENTENYGCTSLVLLFLGVAFAGHLGGVIKFANPSEEGGFLYGCIPFKVLTSKTS